MVTHPRAAERPLLGFSMHGFRVLFISLSDDTGCERLPIELIRQGVDCACLSPPGFQCANVTGLARFPLPAHRGFWLGTLALSGALRRSVDAFAPDLLLPLDDIAAWILRGLCDSPRTPLALRALIERSTGMAGGREAARWRIKLMDAATGVGVPVPGYRAFDNLRALVAAGSTLVYPVVVKEENSCGGRGVVIVESEAELRRVFAPALRLFSARALVGRLRGWARRMLWHWAGMPSDLWRSILVQRRILGRPALCTVVADRGQVLECFCLVAERNHPEPTGASTVVRFIAHERMEAAAARLVRHLGYSGFVSFDFILSPDESQATLIEMNGRPVGTVHLGRRFGRDLCGASLRLLDETMATPRHPGPVETRLVALFPKELERDPGAFRDGVPAGLLHDVPQGEDAVVKNYGRRLARLHPTRTAEIWEQIAAASEQDPGADGGGLPVSPPQSVRDRAPSLPGNEAILAGRAP